MANKCGQCLFFQDPNQKCGAGRRVNGTLAASAACFKGPASLFGKNVCGGCRLFQGLTKIVGQDDSLTVHLQRRQSVSRQSQVRNG